MTITANQFGTHAAFSSSTRVFSTSGQATRVPGTTRLFTSSALPAGLLFKEVGSLSEALDCGGLLLTHKTSGRWMILVGETLLAALHAKKLGKTRSYAQTEATLQFVRSNLDDGFIHNEHQVPNRIDKAHRPGGDLLRPEIISNYFPQVNGEVEMYGVVTGANVGMGTSHTTLAVDATTYRAGTGRTVLQTTIPSSVPLVTMIRQKFGPALLELAPESVRQYYVDTFESVLAGIPAEAKPTLGIVQMWEGLNKRTGYRFKPRAHTGVWGQGVLTAANVIGTAYQSTIGAQNYTKEEWYESYSVQDAGPVVATTSAPPVFRFPTRLGETYDGLMTLMDSTVVELTPYDSPQGIFDGLNASVIRDGMCLGDSLVNSSLTPNVNNYAGIGEYLAAAHQEFGVTREGLAAKAATMSEINARLLMVTEASSSTIPNSTIVNLYQPGTLGAAIEKFSRDWDQAAQAEAS